MQTRATQHTQSLLQKWRRYSPAGLTLIGLGCSVLGESIARKATSTSIWDWFWWGSAALVFINAGIAVFGEAIKSRVLYEMQTEMQTEMQSEIQHEIQNRDETTSKQ